MTAPELSLHTAALAVPRDATAEEAVEARARAVLAGLSVDEKVAQLVGLWEDTGEGTDAEVAPMQHEMVDEVESFDAYARHGLGRLDRVYGNQPIAPAEGAAEVVRQQELLTARGAGIPAFIQEELLVGVMTYGATAFPSPLSWGATFDPGLIRRMGEAVGDSARAAGVTYGLAPVLDVVVDSRWGRTEECIGEDPYLIGVLGSAWVAGVQSRGVVATAKHFAGHSASLGARNQAPAALGPREFADLHLLPFEMAVRLARVGSVMHSYAGVDGMPPAGDRVLLTEILRERFGFDGFVVADFLGVTFLHTHHKVAASLLEAGAMALTAGLDMELTNAKCFPLVGEEVKAGRFDAAVLDEAVLRVLRAKARAGLLDGVGPGGDPAAARAAWEPTLGPDGSLDLDPAAHRALAREVAEASIVLLENSGLLPIPAPVALGADSWTDADDEALASDGDLALAVPGIAVVGPAAASWQSLLGDYAFANHVEERFEVPPGIAVPTVVDAVRAEYGSSVTFAAGGTWQGASDDELDEAVRVASEADVVVAVVGDKPGLFGRGSVGEGCDVTTLALPGRQDELLERLLTLDVPVVIVVVSGRGYALASYRDRAAAIVQAFLPGEEGASAIAGVLSGRVTPSGRLPLSLPLSADASPYTYRQPTYGRTLRICEVPSGAAWPFGHGLSYTTFAWSSAEVTLPTGEVVPLEVGAGDGVDADAAARGEFPGAPGWKPSMSAVGAEASLPSWPITGSVSVSVTVTNTGDVAGADVVQLYLTDSFASAVRPLVELVGFARVPLAPGESRVVTFDVHADRLSFTGAALRRVVEPGEVVLRLRRSAEHEVARLALNVVGDVREVGSERELLTGVRVGPAVT
ncbi:MAG: glycoside hydrolase family 3 N-terminal domain-containing protein [Kineosporiaceae bacterium]